MRCDITGQQHGGPGGSVTEEARQQGNRGHTTIFLTAYEQQRQQNIAANEAKLRDLGLDVSDVVPSKKKSRRRRRRPEHSDEPSRRSKRRVPRISYKEPSDDPLSLVQYGSLLSQCPVGMYVMSLSPRYISPP